MFGLNSISPLTTMTSQYIVERKDSSLLQADMPTKQAKDKLEISEQGKAKFKSEQEKTNKLENKEKTETQSGELSESEKKLVQELKQRDQEVKAHEQTHKAAGGALVRGGASYSYQLGPDGKRYAIGGEVQIDVSEESDPRATKTKMQQVRRAALAPAEPSAQDRAVASMASRIEAAADSEIKRQNAEQAMEPTTGSKEQALSAFSKRAMNSYQSNYQ